MRGVKAIAILILIALAIKILAVIVQAILDNLALVIFLLLLAGAVIGGIRYIKWKAKQLEEQEAHDLHQSFLRSPEYRYIEQFARKYSRGTPSKDNLAKLQALLRPKWHYSTEQMLSMVSEEQETQAYIAFRTRVLFSNPSSYDDYLHSFLSVYGERYEDYLPLLFDLFKEKRLCQAEDYERIVGEVKRAKEQLDLRHFEARLFAVDSPMTMQEIDQLGGPEFEGFLKRLFENMGYQVEQTKLSGDQGADLVLTKFGEKIVVQAKRYSGTVGNGAVQEVLGAISHYRADRGMVVTNNFFSKPAQELAHSNGIELIDRQRLDRLLQKYVA